MHYPDTSKRIPESDRQAGRWHTAGVKVVSIEETIAALPAALRRKDEDHDPPPLIKER